MLELPCLIICIGSSKSGKSHLIKSLIFDHSINHDNGFKFGLVFTKTKFNQNYDFLPDDYVIENFDMKILTKFLNKLVDTYKNNTKKKKPIPYFFIIFDDICSLTTSMTKS